MFTEEGAIASKMVEGFECQNKKKSLFQIYFVEYSLEKQIFAHHLF